MSEQYKTFILQRKRKIPELPCELRECIHTPSGARIIHIASDDIENVFCLAFQTLPSSSNGIAHVLEHLVLCGSKRFPVKDPFFAMIRRSMNTFMNAFTGTDCTYYPAASQIEKDFYNLLDVYVDAVFFPQLPPLSFLQEAHRLEFDNNNHLAINGVVYNEMKGAFSNPMRRLLQEAAQRIFPDSPYGNNTGGDPAEIRCLTLDEVRSFHKTYYHPSQCLFFFYGNLPLKKHLDFLEDKILGSTKKASPIPPPQLQPRFSSPKNHRIEYPIPQGEAALCYVSFSWLTTTLQNHSECLALTLLESMLLSTDAAPLKYALLQTKKCKQISSSCDTELLEVPFNIILSGCKEKDIPELQTKLLQTLEHIAVDGFSTSSVETAMHELELAKSEITGGGTPFGLSLFWRAAPELQHGMDPMKGLEIHALFDELRAVLAANPRYFSFLIEKYFLQNTHFVQVTMAPSTTKEQEERSEEIAFLQGKEASLHQADKETILKQMKSLEELQEEEQDLSCLPMLQLQDVPKPCKKILLHHETLGTADLFSHTPFTNAVSYLSLVFPLPRIPEEDWWLIRLFSLLLTQLGCGNRTYRESLDYLQTYTGGVYASVSLAPQASNAHEIIPSWILRGKCLDRNIENLASILSDFLLAPRFDEKGRIREIVEKHGTDLHNALQSMALEYATSKASASLTPSGAILEELYGLSYYKKIKKLIASYSAQEKWLFTKLSEIGKLILHASRMQMVYCGDASTLLSLKETNFFGLAEITGKPFHPWISPPLTLKSEDIFYCIPTNVSFTAIALPTISYLHPHAPKLSVLSALMNNTFLHKRLREQGGAYGGGSSAHVSSGTFSFYSYRDPHLFSTLQAYESSIRWIDQGTFTKEQLEEAKLSVLQDLDCPIPPGNRAEVAYFWWRQGKSEEARQHFKNLVLETTKEDLQSLISLYFQNKINNSAFIALTNKESAIKNISLFAKVSRHVIKKQL